jgi:hypothetical protein
LDFNRNDDNNKVSNTVVNSTINQVNRQNRLATGRDELINRNLNLGTGRLDDPRPVGVA